MNEWVDVNYALPVRGRNYLVTDGKEVIMCRFSPLEKNGPLVWNFDRNQTLDGWSSQAQVKYWMKVPKPPK